MSEPRIRWEDGGSEMIALCGHVGGLSATVFRILRPWSTFEHWAVSCTLAGSGPVRRGNGPEELKAQAERWLEEFVSSLGASFPGDPFEFDDDDGEPLEALYAPGRRVRFTRPGNGYPGEGEAASALLTLGGVYTIAWSDIGFAKSRLGLAGISGDHGQGFNSVLFEPVPEGEEVPDDRP